jgi:hypothetical protein
MFHSGINEKIKKEMNVNEEEAMLQFKIQRMTDDEDGDETRRFFSITISLFFSDYFKSCRKIFQCCYLCVVTDLQNVFSQKIWN